jgi:hypothetical protein
LESDAAKEIPAWRLQEVTDRQIQWVVDGGLAPLAGRAAGELPVGDRARTLYQRSLILDCNSAPPKTWPAPSSTWFRPTR